MLAVVIAIASIALLAVINWYGWEYAQRGKVRMMAGQAATCVLTCMIFAAMYDSSVATTFAIGAYLADILQRPALFPVGTNAALLIIGMFIETSATILMPSR